MRTSVLLLVICSLAFAPAPLPKTPRKAAKDQNSILGPYKQDGHPTVTLVVTPTTFTYVNADRAPSAYFLTFDPTRVPKTYDLHRNPDFQDSSYQGIYKVEGDVLTVYYNGGRNRPTSFDQLGGIKETFTRVSHSY